MPNEIVTRAIDAVASGESLTADHATAVLDEIMEGRSSEVQTAAFLIALRAKGETVAELAGLARTMRRLAAGVEARPRRPRGHGRDRGRAVDLQHLDRRRAGGGGRRLRGRQARQPLQHQPLRIGRSARGARACGSTSTPRRVAKCIDEVGLRVHVRPAPSRRDEARRPGSQGAGGADDLQLPRPAHQPGGRHGASSLGVSDRRYQETIAEALLSLGCERALVVRAEDGLDELSIAGPTRVIEVADGSTEEWFAEPGGRRPPGR